MTFTTPDGNYWDLKSSTVISVLSEQARNIYTNRQSQFIRPKDVVFDCGVGYRMQRFRPAVMFFN